MTIAIGLVAYFAVVDFPEKAAGSYKFLNAEEIKMMNDRVELDRHDSHTPPFHIGSYLKNGLDWKVWVFALIFGATTTVTYAVAYFLPIILRVYLGFNIAEAQCLTAPLYVFGAVCMWLEGLLSDSETESKFSCSVCTLS